MRFPFLRRPLVGLDIGISGIKAVELHGTKTPRLVAYNRVPLPWQAILDGEIRERELVVGALRKLFDTTGFNTRRVAVGTSGNAVITKKITIPNMTEAELNHQLYWEAEQYIPFNISEVNLDYAVLGPSHHTGAEGPMMEVILVAARKDYIQSLASVVEDAGLTPAVIDLQAFALGNAFEFNYGHLQDSSDCGMSLIIDFGAGSTKLAVVEGDKTTFTRELKLCGISCTQSIAQALGVPFETAEKIKITEPDQPEAGPALSQFLNMLMDEISRTLDLILSQGSDRTLMGIYVCGGASRTAGLLRKLGERLPAKVQPLNPVQNISGSGRKMSAAAISELSYLGAVAIGLALRFSEDT